MIFKAYEWRDTKQSWEINVDNLYKYSLLMKFDSRIMDKLQCINRFWIWIKFYSRLNVFTGFSIYFIFQQFKTASFCRWQLNVNPFSVPMAIKHHRAFFSEKSRPLTACHPMERHLTDDYWHSTWSVAAHFTWIESELSGTVFEVLSFRTQYINITRKSPINRNILTYDNKTIYSIFNHLFLIQRTL